MITWDATVAVDIGKWVSGVAIFGPADSPGPDPRLLHATEVKLERVAGKLDPDRMARALYDHVWRTLRHEPQVTWVAEEMVDYPGKGAREDDLEHLRESVEALRLMLFGHERFLTRRAAAWKGGTSKAVTEYRVREILTTEEFALVKPWTKETWDAIGLGLVQTGRASRGVVPVRPPQRAKRG